jgi:hypothetical protein
MPRMLRQEFSDIRTDHHARELAARWAEALWEDEGVARRWIRAGMGMHDHEHAGALHRAGIRPHHLTMRLENGRTVWALIRDGERLGYIMVLIQRAAGTD